MLSLGLNQYFVRVIIIELIRIKLNSLRRINLLSPILCWASWLGSFQNRLSSSSHLYLVWSFIMVVCQDMIWFVYSSSTYIECLFLIYARHCVRLWESSVGKTGIVSVLTGLIVWYRRWIFIKEPRNVPISCEKCTGVQHSIHNRKMSSRLVVGALVRKAVLDNGFWVEICKVNWVWLG